MAFASHQKKAKNHRSERPSTALSRQDRSGGTVVRKLFGVLAAVMLAFLLVAPPAEARCWSNGYGWHCTHYRHHYWHARYWYLRHYYRPYYYGYYRPYYRPYACTPWPLCWG